jgi:endonuclease YncB( thermonuclease family)
MTTMKRALKLITLVGGIACSAFAFSATLTGKVVGVSDGDTITLLDVSKTQHRIRLAGIDAPEKNQPFGDRSKQNLSNLVFAKNVTVEWDKTDKYGRTIGKVVAEGKDASLEQVRAGLAWHYKQYQNEQSASDRGAYAAAEDQARSRGVGLWRDPRSIPPWDFRHKTGDAVTSVEPNHNGACPCSGQAYCTGKRGGHYCYSANGKKRYIH